MNVVLKQNSDVSCYFITKHSWKGKYKRIFSVGTKGITTYNPTSFEVTNQWPYEEFISIKPNDRSPSSNNEFCIMMKKNNKKTDTMRFSTDHRSDLLTDALRFHRLFADKNYMPKRYQAYKQHWSDRKVSTCLEINPGSLDQINPRSGQTFCSYDYKDMEGISLVSDYDKGLVIMSGGFGRMHMFSVERRDELIQSILETSSNYVGVHIRLKKEGITLEQFQLNKFGKYSTDEALTSCAEFTVQKKTLRVEGATRRTLCLTETCLVERDPATYNIITCKPLCDIFSIVRPIGNPQEFNIEYVKGEIRTYTSTDRDALLASVMDGVRASGNRDVHVKMKFTNRGHRLVPVDEEVESQHLKFLQNPPPGMTATEVLSRFNSNVSYSGLLHAVTAETLFAENKERLINGALSSLLESNGGDVKTMELEDLEAQLHALRRLVASKAGFAAFTALPQMREKVGIKVVKALKRNDLGVSHAAVDMLCSLMQPMHDNYDLRQEQLNKSAVLSSKKFLESLLDMFTGHVNRGSGALVIAAMLDFLTYSLCAPYSETTDGACFDTLLEMVASNGRAIFKLFQHPSLAIVKGAGLVMKAIIEEGDAEVSLRMQDLSLAEGALPKHLHTALFTSSTDNRMLTVRQLSRHLIGLWITGHETSMSLLKRMMPVGLLSYLDSKDDVPDDDVDRINVRDNLKLAQILLLVAKWFYTTKQEQDIRKRKNVHLKQIEKHIEGLLVHWKNRLGIESNNQVQQDKVVVLRKRRQRIKPEANWKLFYYQFNKDHAKPNLIWNYKTREELRLALEDEIRSFNVDKELSGGGVVSWNHLECEVQYPSLAEEIKIGNYYLRILLEEDEKEESSNITQSYEFFNDLYHRFLLSSKIQMKAVCLQAMSIVYGRCHQDIGPFNDTKFIVTMLERSVDRLERDRLIMFINKLLLNKRNVKDVMDANGVKILVDLLTMAHLHVNRAVVPMQSNVIEATPNSQRESEKEWYYGMADKERLGPYSLDEMKQFWAEGIITAKTRCWAQGMDGWRPLQLTPQLKWTFMATGQAVLNESDLATLILNMFIKMAEFYPSRDVDNCIIRPLPRIKRFLTDPSCLPHIVQLLVTFDPVLVEKVATLLYLIMDENPCMPRLYLSGAFFFILMYTGSNVLPIARLLKNTHLKQAFRSDEKTSSDIMQKSVLGHMLPEAMVCYLENYEPEKFAEIFLGEFDTPEAIWSREMRRLMIERIASHVGDFSPRLLSNTRALYQYCPIPVIVYPQLENELFCSIYYLRHLCDTARFPDWPIMDPIRLLKDILKCWKVEVEKKPPSMSVDEALETLNLDLHDKKLDEAVVRKAYFRLAHKYHPDKNPDGREMFEKVNKAYEFLCSRVKLSDGPNPENIVLILKSQSILFERFRNVLAPYKYAGYPMLIRTIQLESVDDALFSKSAPILSAAAQLSYHTVNCSALNAEELRREGGIEILHDAFSRCVGVISRSSKPEDLAVCTHIVQCFGVSAQFDACRTCILALPTIVQEVTRILYYNNVPKLCQHVAECITLLSVDATLQDNMLKAGVLWHLLLFLFEYDYTLEEGGVNKSDETNQQETKNNLAKLAIHACARLAGCLSGEFATPSNPFIKKCLASMLTPYLANKLADNQSAELLKLLNRNTENPMLVWNNETRLQLIEYLTDQQQLQIRTGECDPTYGSTFQFSRHEKELIIGDVFVRIYNQQPTFMLDDAKSFTMDLIDYLGSQAQSVERILNVEASLEALHNVIKNNPGVEMQCIGHFKLLFALLRVDGYPKVQQHALEVISLVTANQDCVNDISASQVMSYLLLVIMSLPQHNCLTLQVMHPLTSNTRLLKEIINKGGLIYLLHLFCNSTSSQVREQAADLMSRMMADKLVGPRVRIILLKFLPNIFMDAMRESAETSVALFEGTHENPELIWNEDARSKVSWSIRDMKDDFYGQQKNDPTMKWTIDETMTPLYASETGELVVGDVYLRLFINNPGWVVRKPKEFMVELFEKWTQLVSMEKIDGESLETVTTALTLFLNVQSSMLDQVPQLGHIPKLFTSMLSNQNAVPASAMKIVQQLSNSQVCIRSMSQTESMRPMKVAMKGRRDVVGVACDALMKMFSCPDDDLIEQILKAEMIPFLLGYLQTGLEGLDNSSSVKAQIVKGIKSLLTNAKYTEQLMDILEKSVIWKDYKDQKHDLFLADNPCAGYLTGSGVAGYLTAATSPTSSMPSIPPPII
ncbi:hypothetical protein HELRODRAFT_156562 [Helobdella robusta]|uniref:J domain-containing protein n=1 Tax=Helobdella robusta TaxID=6412 RepID=T1ELY2_HELRO|nr:hypothetical protein HELRODRAFT_156562 [Helobdella robusta]ESO09053.1 hypothetical protein HELRODRAFT_156562 [Helobdella robusta]